MSLWENLLLRAERERDSAETCAALSKFYSASNPVRALAYACKANRLGADLRLDALATAVSLAAAQKDPVGSFLLGREYTYDSNFFQDAFAYLRVAADSDDRISGQASLYLADFLSANMPEEEFYRTMAYHYYQTAAEKGYADTPPFRNGSDF